MSVGEPGYFLLSTKVHHPGHHPGTEDWHSVLLKIKIYHQ